MIIVDPRAARIHPPVMRTLTLDDVRMAIAARCDRLVARQRGGWDAGRQRVIEEMRVSYDALTGAIHGTGGTR